MAQVTPLEADIRRRIAAAGPMPVGEYMSLCLLDPAHGYYTTRDPIGAGGDFVTAPEVSQMFGELIGLWMAAVWKQMGSPSPVRVVELGPGRGTLMKDALRALKVMPGFSEAITLHFVEINPILKATQQRTLEGAPQQKSWHGSLAEVPSGPAIIVANEFFDALPVNQAVKRADGWHHRCVDVGADGRLAFTVAAEPIPHFSAIVPPALRDAPLESIFEWRDDKIAMDLGKRIADQGGAALVIDYGHTESALGDTLQAVARHAFADALSAPGTVDLTAHVDFEALAKAVEAMGAQGHGPIVQAQLLRRLGIETRAAALKAKADHARAAEIDLALARLIGAGRSGMGMLFKAAAFTHPALGTPPAF
ncbi:MAG: SAM-dependent methyltransferase [Pseudolabrys sp.]|nr:SAM-dependent methyltransferase [Pseudolabrys sp.]